MNWTPDAYLEKLYCDHRLQYEFNAVDINSWLDWREKLRSKLIEALGEFPVKEEDLEVRLLEQEEFSTYTRERIEYTTYPYMRVPAYVLIPKGVRRQMPAIVACPGHGYGAKESIGLLPDGKMNEGDSGVHKNFALELVKKGFIVIVPEVLGFGDRRLIEDKDKDPKENSCYRLATYLLMLGKTLIGHRVYETKRAIDYLMTREEVRKDRIGCMGLSGGGLLAALTSAVDDRIFATVVSCYTNTYKDSIMAMRHCIDNYIPGILKYTEMEDVIGLIAPRALFVEAGKEDPIFPVEGAKKAITKLEKIYTVANARNNLDCDIFPGKHEVWGIKAYAWLEELISR